MADPQKNVVLDKSFDLPFVFRGSIGTSSMKNASSF